MSVQPSARSTLISLVEEHITSLVREAVEVKRHSKRARLHQASSDDDRGVVRHRLHAEDINLALQWRGSEKLYATGTVIPPDDVLLPGGSDGTTTIEQHNIHMRNGMTHNEDGSGNQRQINLEEYLKTEMNLRPPSEVGLTVHWLAVDGTQPEIPQNPPPMDDDGDNNIGTMLHPIYDSSTTTTPHAIHATTTNGSSSGAGAGAGAMEDVGISQLFPVLLSEELQMYFTRITIAIQRGSATPMTRQQQDSAIMNVARDAGLQELVPFFAKYVVHEIQNHLHNPDHCRTLVRLIQAMLQNPHLHLELHLHLLIPILMTCIVASRLCTLSTDNHWALRREAAQTLLRALNLFGNEYPTLKPKVLAELTQATEPNKPLSTIYGGIVAISFFGAKAIDAFLLPKISLYWKKWEETLTNNHAEEIDYTTCMEIHMCQQAVLNSLGTFLRRVCYTGEALRFGWEELEGTFGDKLVVHNSAETEYSLCVV